MMIMIWSYDDDSSDIHHFYSILLFYRDAGMQPYHVHTYVRLSNLWANGGIFSDFSFFFLGTLTKNVIKYVSS